MRLQGRCATGGAAASAGAAGAAAAAAAEAVVVADAVDAAQTGGGSSRGLERHGAAVLDQWGAAWIQDFRLWDSDRIHLIDEGHRRMARAAAAALGLPGADGEDWRTPLPPQPPRELRVALTEEPAWVRGFVAPWIGRRLRGRSSGDGRAAKRPVPLALPRR